MQEQSPKKNLLLKELYKNEAKKYPRIVRRG